MELSDLDRLGIPYTVQNGIVLADKKYALINNKLIPMIDILNKVRVNFDRLHKCGEG